MPKIILGLSAFWTINKKCTWVKKLSSKLKIRLLVQSKIIWTYTANAYRQTTDKLMCVISTVR